MLKKKQVTAFNDWEYEEHANTIKNAEIRLKARQDKLECVKCTSYHGMIHNAPNLSWLPCSCICHKIMELRK